VLFASPAAAQISVPYSFSAGTRAQSAQVNANFAMLADALNRTGGAMTGTLTTRNVLPDGNNTRDLGASGTRFANIYGVLGSFSSNLTVGGTLDVTGAATLGSTLALTSNATIGGTLDVTGAATLGSTLGVTGAVTVSSTAAGALDVAGGINAGSGNVGIVDTTGKIPAISSTYFASLSGTNLTGVGLLASANSWTARQDFSANYSEEQATQTLSSAGALNINLSNGTHHTVTLNANATSLNITNEGASGKATSFVLQLAYSSNTTRTVTWTGVTWAGGAAPTLTCATGKSDFFTFISYDGGSTWYGFVGGQNF
jgi:fibronectin-binding autotransporter adhesin